VFVQELQVQTGWVCDVAARWAAFLVAVGIGWAVLAPTAAHGEATVYLINVDAPEVGLNDPTPAAPVGGNVGTTVGEQRLIAIQHAAELWGQTLDSAAEIRIQVSFVPLACTATTAVLGSAGTIQLLANFPGAAYPDTWYNAALANKRAGFDLLPGEAGTSADDIRARFNVNLGAPGCFTGAGWYYGLDNNHGRLTDLVTVVLHELAHGLGMQNFVDETDGEQVGGLTDVFSRNTLDTTIGLTWDQMTDVERAASARNSRGVVWTGEQVTAEAPAVLVAGTPLLRVNFPPGLAGRYSVGTATFGPPLNTTGVAGRLVEAVDAEDEVGPSPTDGCSPLANAAEVAGKVALIDRGGCTFAEKASNAQNAGAVAVVIADNAPGSPPAALGGTDPTILIPSVRITRGHGVLFKSRLAAGDEVQVTVGIDATVLSGADPAGRLLLHAPNPVQSGSSIVHWDPIAAPNLLMEPIIGSDLSHSVTAPKDLTLALLRDLGWYPDADVDGVPDGEDCEPYSDRRETVVIHGCDTGVPNPLFVTGCTLTDLINDLEVGADNHGAYVSAVTALTDELRSRELLSGKQKGAIQACAARAPVP
jgi:hypothetical protein